MGLPPRPFSENQSPIPPSPSPHLGPLGPEQALGYGGFSSDSEAVQRIAGESARVFDAILGHIQGVASHLIRELDDEAQRAEMQTIVRFCHEGNDLIRKLGVISLRDRPPSSLLDLTTLLPDLDMGAAVPEEILYCEDFPEVPCRVRTDADRMEQVMRALVANAVDAFSDAETGTPGVIWVGLERIGGRIEDGDRRVGWIHLQVADNGCGMDPTIASRAFAPFFTTKTDPPGLGLGLTVAEGFIHQAGGTINLESAPGWGTRVNVWLPVGQGPDAAAEMRL